MEAVIEVFAAENHGDGSGSGSGSGSGDGSGYGYGSGSGDGSGYGYGSGSGDGSGYGSGSGYGDGDGSGYGSGYGYGDGSGSGSGYGIKVFNGDAIHAIDDMPTIIKSVKGNLARGFILQSDLTLMPCFVAKQGDLFAHGNNAREARDALMAKVMDDMDVDEKVDMFMSEFKRGAKYPARKFYDWHHNLTGSCAAGRDAFAKDHGIDVDNDRYTVEEFIALTESAYGREVIARLKERWAG